MISAAYPDHVDCGFFCHLELDKSAAVRQKLITRIMSPHVVFSPEPPDWIGPNWQTGSAITLARLLTIQSATTVAITIKPLHHAPCTVPSTIRALHIQCMDLY